LWLLAAFESEDQWLLFPFATESGFFIENTDLLTMFGGHKNDVAILA
jgi:hypothetical protein